ncbi:TetR/AcrR family transcriptional regulator [Spirosoma koreense]
MLETNVASKKRNRPATIQRIVKALEHILAQEGLEGVNVNAIAQTADVSKVLVYRYFGSVEGLLEYYIRMGKLVPHYDPGWLAQLRPVEPSDMARVWSSQTLELFRRMRACRGSRELLKASVREKTPLAEAVSRNLDAELTNLVNQLAFLEGGDYQAISAIMLGALSYLTIQAQLDHPVIGIDLRSQEGWQRIEAATTTIYKALNRSALELPTAKLVLKQATQQVSVW